MNCRRAFTVIELLIVLLIIGLLLSLLMPALTAVRAVVDSVSCQNNIRNLAQAMLAYSEKSANGVLPYNANDFEADGVTPSRYRALWVVAKEAGAGSDVAKQQLRGILFDFTERERKLFQCPAFVGHPKSLMGEQIACHYAVPTILSGMPAAYPSKASFNGRDLAGVPMIVEPFTDPDNNNGGSLGTYQNGQWQELIPGSKILVDGGWEGSDKLSTRHQDRARTHIGFHDGHVESIKLQGTEANVTASNFTMVITYYGVDAGGNPRIKTLSMGGTNNHTTWNQYND